MRVLLSMALIFGLSSLSWADELKILNGGTLTGRVVEEREDSVVFETRTGVMTIQRSRIASLEIDSTSDIERYYEQKTALVEGAAEDFHRLAEWADAHDQGRLAKDARREAARREALEEYGKSEQDRSDLQRMERELLARADREAIRLSEELLGLSEWARRRGLDREARRIADRAASESRVEFQREMNWAYRRDLFAEAQQATAAAHSTRQKQFRDRLTTLTAGGTAEDLLDLGRWAQQHSLHGEAKKAFLLALRRNPEHETVRRALGYRLHEGAWKTEEEIYLARGYVKYDGEWMSEEDRDFRLNEKRLDLERRLVSVESRESRVQREEREVRELAARVDRELREVQRDRRELEETIRDRTRSLEKRLAERERALAREYDDAFEALEDREAALADRERSVHERECYFDRHFRGHYNRLSFCATHRVWWSGVHHTGCPYCDHCRSCR
jgi:hypothetical protein